MLYRLHKTWTLLDVICNSFAMIVFGLMTIYIFMAQLAGMGPGSASVITLLIIVFPAFLLNVLIRFSYGPVNLVIIYLIAWGLCFSSANVCWRDKNNHEIAAFIKTEPWANEITQPSRIETKIRAGDAYPDNIDMQIDQMFFYKVFENWNLVSDRYGVPWLHDISIQHETEKQFILWFKTHKYPNELPPIFFWTKEDIRTIDAAPFEDRHELIERLGQKSSVDADHFKAFMVISP